MALSLGDRRIWGLLAIVVLTTASILGLRMLGLYEGFDAPAPAAPAKAPAPGGAEAIAAAAGAAPQAKKAAPPAGAKVAPL